MNKNQFQAFHWIQETSDKANQNNEKTEGQSNLPPFHRQLRPVANHQLLKYLNPGWTGQSLCSKKYFKCLSYLQTLQSDLIHTLKTENFPPKHLKLIFNEYKSFNNNSLIENMDLPKFAQLLKEIGSSESALCDFANYYSARLVMLYFLQLRLLRTLHHKLNIAENMKELLSPPLALNKIFAKGTTRELKAKSLETNQYSWYRPSEVRLPQVYMLFSLANDLNFPETLKLLHSLQKQPSSENHSHALSHLGIGLLINCLQVNLPKWHKNLNTTTEVNHQNLLIESSLYLGDYLEELSVSHWIAQENNKHFAWDEILCPDFAQYSYEQSPFEFFYHEIQQLQLICDIHDNYNVAILDFITNIFKRWQKNIHSHHQTEFQLENQNLSKKNFDRLILSSLINNKQNTHHNLIQKIQSNLNSLKDDGYLLVLTNQNLYLPSQSNKVSSLLKILQPICTIDLTEVKGKGESPDFIYVLRKKHGIEINNSNSFINSTFRFRGNLNSFQNFCHIPEDLNKFFQRFLKNTPTIYQNTNASNANFQFDFYQSPIINGIQVYSNDNETQQITHPQFLKKLLHNTMPLNYFFNIQHLDSKDLIQAPPSWSMEQKLPISHTSAELDKTDENCILILDLKEIHMPQIKLTNLNKLPSDIQEHGFSECFYYKLTAKFKHLNLGLFELFINSKIGKQIAGITLIGNKYQVRSKINSLLVPTFILNPIEQKLVPPFTSNESISNFLANLNSSSKDFKQLINDLSNLYYYKIHITKMIKITMVEVGNWKDIDFNTPAIREVLPQMSLMALYPDNMELSIDFKTEHRILSQLYLDKHELVFDPVLSKINLLSENTTHLSISGNTAHIIFVHFLLKQIPRMKVLEILTNVRIPSSNDCTRLLQIKQNEVQMFEQLNEQINLSIEKLIHCGINH